MSFESVSGKLVPASIWHGSGKVRMVYRCASAGMSDRSHWGPRQSSDGCMEMRCVRALRIAAEGSLRKKLRVLVQDVRTWSPRRMYGVCLNRV